MKKIFTVLIALLFSAVVVLTGCFSDEEKETLFAVAEYVEPMEEVEPPEENPPTREIIEEITQEIKMETEKTEFENLVTFQIVESTVNHTAYVKAIINQDAIPEEAVGAEFSKLYIDEKVVAEFTSGNFEAIFTPKSWGRVLPSLAFFIVETDPEPQDVEVFRVDGLQMSIEPATWFLSAQQEINFEHRMFPASGGTDEIFSEQGSVSDMSMLFLYSVRIPAGETLTIGKDVLFEARPYSEDFIGHPLRAVHYRGEEYRNRFDLYENPDAPCYNINPEPDKWIQGPISLEAGVHVVYIAPSEEHDRTRVEVVSEDSRGRVYRHVTHTRSVDWGWLFPDADGE